MKTAVYGGSFDPPTKGHLWMIEEAAAIFDHVIVTLAVNPDKRPTFSTEVRRRMLEEMTSNLPNVSVRVLEGGYLVQYAVQQGATHLIRGIRNESDYESERAIRQVNADIEQSIKSVYLMPPRDLSEVSSSLVRGLVGPDGWERLVAKYVPTPTLIRLIANRHDWLWRGLVEEGASGDADALWNACLLPYFEKGRFHHSWTHIADSLNELYRIRNMLRSPGLVGLALLLHDVTYDTSRSDNEEKSAELCRALAQKLGLPDEVGEMSARMIEATKGHASNDPDTRLLLDVDLSILGASERRFDEYEAGVAREYSQYSAEEFASGRAKWIRGFLEEHPERIYFTDLFEKKYGAQARRNLERSLAHL